MKSSKQHKRAKEILIEASLQMCYMFDWHRSITVCNPSDCELAATAACSFFSCPSMKPWKPCTFLLDKILLVGVNLILVRQKTQHSYKCFYSKRLCNWVGLIINLQEQTSIRWASLNWVLARVLFGPFNDAKL